MASKTREQRIAELLQRETEIQAQLKRLRSLGSAEKRKLDTRMKIIVGAAVMLERSEDPAFDARIQAVLDKRVRAPRDRAVLGLQAMEMEA